MPSPMEIVWRIMRPPNLVAREQVQNGALPRQENQAASRPHDAEPAAQTALPADVFLRFSVALLINGRAQKPTLSTTPNVKKRSEERRVGKECRSRWSPYH